MSAIDYVNDVVLDAALYLLPAKMDTQTARAMLVAIGLQESKFQFRHQVGGPARGFWQFELGGVSAVMSHTASKQPALDVLDMLQYEAQASAAHVAIEHNDVLAGAIARLLLWTHPRPLPAADDAQGAWDYYVWLWRPGKPHRDAWDQHYAKAWEVIA